MTRPIRFVLRNLKRRKPHITTILIWIIFLLLSPLIPLLCLVNPEHQTALTNPNSTLFFFFFFLKQHIVISLAFTPLIHTFSYIRTRTPNSIILIKQTKQHLQILILLMERYQNPYQQQQMMIGGSAVVGAGETSASGDRFPQWSAQETNEFLLIRAELDRTFMETKRNKVLWEVMAARLKEKGFSRSAEQCKSKWKNLVTRYKGCETMEPEAMRQQFPFYNELHAIFSSRLQQMLWAEAEGSAATIQGGVVGKKRKALATTSKHMSSDDDDDDEEEDEDGDGENNKGSRKRVGRKKKKKTKSDESGGELRELLEGFMKEQAEMESRWREVYEAREEERRRREETWRKRMEALQEERRRTEKSWREREEQRWVREEARYQKRDALITQLLNRLGRDDNI